MSTTEGIKGQNKKNGDTDPDKKEKRNIFGKTEKKTKVQMSLETLPVRSNAEAHLMNSGRAYAARELSRAA